MSSDNNGTSWQDVVALLIEGALLFGFLWMLFR
jgi:hypothetical protein